MTEGAFTLADMAVGGGSAGLTFWGAHLLLKLLFDRAEKREARLDAGNAELIGNMRKQVDALVGEAKAMRSEMVALQLALQQCRDDHHKRDIEMLELKAMVEGKP